MMETPVIVTNEKSDWCGWVGMADLSGDGFWVPVRLGEHRCLIARRNLEELGEDEVA